jgi:sporulation protein YlmC with PRC-barrel domain
MLQSIKQLYGNKLGASDGDLGHVKDFYFDDRNWAVRYVVADTGNWLSGRQVLISPHAFGSVQVADKVLSVSLTRKQIEDSPSIETHKPVSRQYEEEYHRYYGWPYYWEGDGLWGGMRGFPILETPAKFQPHGPSAGPGLKHKSADADLRSTQAVTGYNLQATDGIIGHVCDFMMDDKSWAISQLVIKTGHRFTGKEVQIPMSQVERISYEESTVFVKLTKEAVEKSPEHRLIPSDAVIPAHPILAL